MMNKIKTKFRLYWPLIKYSQTSLLMITGLAGYMTARCPVTHLSTMLGLFLSLFLTISGSTILNMWYDRDIDAKMPRTSKRPLPAGLVTPQEVLRLGLIVSLIGTAIAVAMDPLYGLIIFGGLFIDVVLYTIWLKRKTAWSIIWGGISGGMPILAGRALGTGTIDWIGIALMFAILFWIPTHILTFSMRYREDYKLAGVPTFPSTYGDFFTRNTIAISSVLGAIVIALAAYGIGTSWGFLRLMGVLSGGLLALAIASVIKPSDTVNFGLFKYASLYMFSAMILLMF
ncbi:MAG: protoheme IX farnesyltransferase [Anaerolineae bacterium]|nr:protoheme IX farnesyltransferase [Anaerolineae bacterium]